VEQEIGDLVEAGMNERSWTLRRHAAHCRFAARSAVNERRRSDLFTIAIKAEDEADTIDALEPARQDC
jgi:hypothetical protein